MDRPLAGIDRPLRLRAWREFSGLSLRRLAILADVTPTTLSLVERGLSRPRPTTLTKIAEALGVSAYDLRYAPRRPSERSRSLNS